MRKAIIIAILSAGLALTGANALAHDEEHYFAIGYLAGSTLGQHSHHPDASDYRHRDYRSRLYRPARIPRELRPDPRQVPPASRDTATGTGTGSSIAVQHTVAITIATRTMDDTGIVTPTAALCSQDGMGIEGSETTDPVVRPGPPGILLCASALGGQILALSSSTSKIRTASGPMWGPAPRSP